MINTSITRFYNQALKVVLLYMKGFSTKEYNLTVDIDGADYGQGFRTDCTICLYQCLPESKLEALVRANAKHTQICLNEFNRLMEEKFGEQLPAGDYTSCIEASSY